MRVLHDYHLVIAVALFVVATVLYAIGVEYGGIAVFVLACIVETAALYIFTMDRSRRTFTDDNT